MEAIPGYLSLHQTADIMTLKWTPNQLMNGSVGDLDYERRCNIIQLQMDYDYGHCVCLQSVPLILLVFFLIPRISNTQCVSSKTWKFSALFLYTVSSL